MKTKNSISSKCQKMWKNASKISKFVIFNYCLNFSLGYISFNFDISSISKNVYVVTTVYISELLQYIITEIIIS